MIEYIFPMHPAVIFIFGALLIPFLKGRWKQIYLLLIPVTAFINLLYLPRGTFWVYSFVRFELILGQIDATSLSFGYIFVIIAFLGLLYSIHLKDNKEHVAAFILTGASLGVVFAGDYISLYIFWKIMTISSALLIFARRKKSATDAGVRYLIVHFLGGTFLFAGIVLYYAAIGNFNFGYLEYGELYFYLILIGFLFKTAVPPFHAWLPDAYPEGSATASVFLSAFTTKTGVYVLIRAFPGTEILIWLGAVMAIYGVVYAVIENDARRLLGYHIISQVGYMVAAVGLGTQMAINGAIAHALCHILYKALLFMGPGAVIQVTGRGKLTELGGLYKAMPLTLIFFIIGGVSISGVPLFSGFVSKSMIVAAAGLQGESIVFLMLVLASVGTFLHTSLKLPYYMFFGKDMGIKAKEPPSNMLVSMGLTAFLCFFIGVYPAILYDILPYPVYFVPFTIENVIGKVTLLLYTLLAFWLLKDKIAGTPTISLDVDWFYRRPKKTFFWFCRDPLLTFSVGIDFLFAKFIRMFLWFSRNPVPAPVHWTDRLSITVREIEARRKDKLAILERLLDGGDIIRSISSASFSVVAMLALFFVYMTLAYMILLYFL